MLVSRSGPSALNHKEAPHTRSRCHALCVKRDPFYREAAPGALGACVCGVQMWPVP